MCIYSAIARLRIHYLQHVGADFVAGFITLLGAYPERKHRSYKENTRLFGVSCEKELVHSDFYVLYTVEYLSVFGGTS